MSPTYRIQLAIVLAPMCPLFDLNLSCGEGKSGFPLWE